MQGTGRLEGEHVARQGAAIVINDDGQPGFLSLALVIGDHQIEQGMIGLPHLIWRLGLTAVEQIKGLRVDVRALVRERQKRRVHLPYNVIDAIIAGRYEPAVDRQVGHLAREGCHRESGGVKG